MKPGYYWVKRPDRPRNEIAALVGEPGAQAWFFVGSPVSVEPDHPQFPVRVVAPVAVVLA